MYLYYFFFAPCEFQTKRIAFAFQGFSSPEQKSRTIKITMLQFMNRNSHGQVRCGNKPIGSVSRFFYEMEGPIVPTIFVVCAGNPASGAVNGGDSHMIMKTGRVALP